VLIPGLSTGHVGAYGPLLKAPAGKWEGWSVTLVGAMPPSRDQTLPIYDSAATELVSNDNLVEWSRQSG
jgi:hypothetical protein